MFFAYPCIEFETEDEIVCVNCFYKKNVCKGKWLGTDVAV